MGSEIRVRSRFRREPDDVAIAQAVVILARIIAEEQGLELNLPKLAPAAVPVVASRSSKRPLCERYEEEIEALKGQGLTNAEAIREVARRYQKSEANVRQSLYQMRRRKVAA